MRHAILATVGLALLAATPAVAQSVDSLIGALRPRPGVPTRGLPSRADDAATVAPTAAAVRAPAPVRTSAATPVSAGPSAMQAAPDPSARPSADVNILFASGSADLTPQAVVLLRKLGEALSSPVMGQSRFTIEGHTDTMGEKDMNLRLSEQRAAAVVAFLIREYNISADRLTASGKGEESLLVPTPDETAHARNRRVHIVNLDG